LQNREIRYPEIKEEFPPGVVVSRFPEREIEEPVELSGAEKKRSCVDPDLWVWRRGGLHHLVSEHRKIFFSFCSRKKKGGILQPCAEKKKQTNTRSTRGT
jgi:hypothetical protein